MAAVEPRLIDKGVAAAERHARTGNLLSMLPNLGVERIDIGEEQLAVVIVELRLLAACGIDADPEREGRITLTTTVRRVRRGHELRLIIPSQDDRPAAHCEEKIMALFGEAIVARKLVIGEAPFSLNQIASKHGRCRLGSRVLSG